MRNRSSGTVLSLGSINADFQMRVDAVASVGVVPARDLVRVAGGKAANAAVIATRLGARAVLLGAVGNDDLAEQALRGPRRDGVDLSHVRRTPGATGFACVVVKPDGDKAIFLAANANDAWGDDADGVAAITGTIELAPAGSVLVVDLEIPPAVVAGALRAAQRRSMPTIVDPAPAARCREEVVATAGHLTPDHLEATDLTGIDATTPSGAMRAARVLQQRGAGAAYVKLRDGGCALATNDCETMVDAPTGLDVVDATGAGDAFAGALAWAVMHGQEPIDGAVTAVAAASCAVTTYGSQASYPTRSQLDAMRRRVTVR